MLLLGRESRPPRDGTSRFSCTQGCIACVGDFACVQKYELLQFSLCVHVVRDRDRDRDHDRDRDGDCCNRIPRQCAFLCSCVRTQLL